MSKRYFRKMVFTDSQPKTSVEKIKEFEESIGLPLPKDYRDFLLQVNGGKSANRGFICVSDGSPCPGWRYDANWMKGVDQSWDEKKIRSYDELLKNIIQPRIITQFLAIDSPEDECIKSYCKRGGEILDVPDTRSLIPVGVSRHTIGDFFVGGDLCISLCKSHYGYVYFGRFGFCTTPENVAGNSVSDKRSPVLLAELEESFVAKSFSKFIDGLFPATTVFMPPYSAPPDIQADISQNYTDDLSERFRFEPREPDMDTPPAGSASTGKKEWEHCERGLVGTLQLSAWNDLIEDENAEVKITISTKEDEIPENVKQAIQYTVKNQKKVKKSIVKAILKDIKKTLKEDEDAFPEMEDIRTAEDLEGNVSLAEIIIVPPQGDEPVRVGYSFDCEWYDEHGYAFLMCEDNIVDVGMAEILDHPYGR